MKLAISMIGKPVLVVLDEPTEGTDPVTKQIIWDALDEIKKNGCSVLITTRSMEECEALCDRIMVMIRDKIKYFGNLDGFKSQYSGYIVAITLEETPRYIRDLDKLRKIMHSTFGGHDDIENRELLVYKTTVDITLYQMFYAMDRIKTANPIVLRYTISNMTWEHIIT
ncbi:uncharacterized protein LOC126845818 [Adelges cooleyi]|uniref:uncharacterized protein LOC126845818 n=1 Tax=Adelges cooleyi TaxID=133065 RepID=UPI00217F702D|nr:uncharacterized protein LOC126845818 [Adelges cooleyi]